MWIGRTTAVQGAAVAAGLPARRADAYARAPESLAIRRPNVADPVARLVLPAIPAGTWRPPSPPRPDRHRARAAANPLPSRPGENLKLHPLALAAAPDVTTVHTVARQAASARARAGDLTGAQRVADVCYRDTQKRWLTMITRNGGPY